MGPGENYETNAASPQAAVPRPHDIEHITLSIFIDGRRQKLSLKARDRNPYNMGLILLRYHRTEETSVIGRLQPSTAEPFRQVLSDLRIVHEIHHESRHNGFASERDRGGCIGGTPLCQPRNNDALAPAIEYVGDKGQLITDYMYAGW